MKEAAPPQSRDRGKRTRQRLLEEALNLLVEGGDRGLTAGRLAERAGVSKATVFHHFPQIDDLGVAVLRHFLDLIAGFLTVDAGGNPEEEIRRLGGTALEMAVELPLFSKAFFHFYQKGFSDLRYRRILKGVLKDFRQEVASALAAASRKADGGGQASEAELLDAALAILTLLDGLTLHYQIVGDRKALRRAYDLVIDGLFARLGI